MRLVNVQAKDPTTKETYKYTFNYLDDNKLVLTHGTTLLGILKDCFCGESCGSFNISVDFLVEDVVYNVDKVIKDDKIVRHVKKLDDNNKLLTVAKDNEVLIYLRTILGGDPIELIENCFVSNDRFNQFVASGDLSVFPKLMDELKDYIAPQEDSPIEQEQVDQLGKEIVTRQASVSELMTQYASQQQKLSESKSYGLTKELSQAKDQLQELENKKDFIDNKRRELADYDRVADIVPRIRNLNEMSARVKDLAIQCQNSKKELDWYENEYSSVVAQLEEKEQVLYKAVTKRANIQAISRQLERAKELEQNNAKLRDSLTELNTQLDNVKAQRIALSNDLDSIEENISEVKLGMDEIVDPDKIISNLLESVRINVKMDELESQMEKYRAEITIKESQIVERENLLANQSRQLRRIMDLDVAVTPYKAREAIMSVVDAKIEKINTINASFKEKQRNLLRLREDINYQLVGLTHSVDTLTAELNKTRQIKGEEFKRQVLINSQKIYQDATAVYAVENDINDDEVGNMEKLLKARIAEKEEVLAMSARISGALDEIQRSVDINQSEINDLVRQKDNIIKHYNQLIHENTNETVSNYLRAIETDKGTNYLMEVSGDVVRNETEVRDIRKNIDNIKLRLSEAQSRYKGLFESRNVIDGEQGTMETMLHINEQTKNELSDVIMRLTAIYNKHKAINEKIIEVDCKLARINELIVETMKTIKVNDREIEYANRQAEKIVGGKIDEAVAQAEFQERETKAEIQMLLGSKTTIETQLFDRKVAYNQLSWLYDNKKIEYGNLSDELHQEFANNNIDAEWVASIVDLSDDNIDKTRETIANYDSTIVSLKERIEYLVKSVEEATPIDRKLMSEMKYTKIQIDKANEELNRAEASYNDALRKIAVATEIKAKKTQAPKLVTAFVKRTNVLLDEMGSGLAINYREGLIITFDGDVIEFNKLSKEEKQSIFIAMTIAYPTDSRVKGLFIIFDEKLGNKDILTTLVNNLLDYCFIIEQKHTKPKEIKE